MSDKDLLGNGFPADVRVEKVTARTLGAWDHHEDVVAIAGSRAMASIAAEMDLPSLKLFQLTSAGFDGVPCDRFAQRGVAVANAGSVYSAPIAETVVFGILLMAKKLRPNPNNRRFKLVRHYSCITELAGKHVLIMGAGNIGTAVADRLAGFGMVIDGYDPFCPGKPQYARILRSREELCLGLKAYDYIVSTLPDNEQTRGFIDQELFDAMKPSAVVVNVGRKAVFDQEAFHGALRTGKIGGAVLDMFERLPNPVTNKFRRLKNVVVLPGVSAISQEVNVRLREHMCRNMMNLLEDRPISNVINGVR